MKIFHEFLYAILKQLAITNILAEVWITDKILINISDYTNNPLLEKGDYKFEVYYDLKPKKLIMRVNKNGYAMELFDWSNIK